MGRQTSSKENKQPPKQTGQQTSKQTQKNFIDGRFWIIISSLFVLTILVYFGYVYFVEPWSPAVRARISNVTSRSATISWVTKDEIKGVVIYGEADSFLPSVFASVGKDMAYDDRDVTKARLEAAAEEQDKIANIDGAEINYEEITEEIVVDEVGSYFVHHVTIKNLKPETEYYFMIGNGVRLERVEIGEEDGGTDGNFVVTHKELEDIPIPNPAYGLIKEWGSDVPVSEGIMYLTLVDAVTEWKSNLISAVLSENGSWYVDLGNARADDGVLYFSGDSKMFSGNFNEELEIECASNGRFSKTIGSDEDAPAAVIILGEPDVEENDSGLKYEGNSIRDEGINSMVSYIWAADCVSTGGSKPCSSCVGTSSYPDCEMGITHGAGGEEWGPGYMQYCKDKHCSAQDPPGCECACNNGSWHCKDNPAFGAGYTCQDHKCVSESAPVVQEPPISGGGGTGGVELDHDFSCADADKYLDNPTEGHCCGWLNEEPCTCTCADGTKIEGLPYGQMCDCGSGVGTAWDKICNDPASMDGKRSLWLGFAPCPDPDGCTCGVVHVSGEKQLVDCGERCLRACTASVGECVDKKSCSTIVSSVWSESCGAGQVCCQVSSVATCGGVKVRDDHICNSKVGCQFFACDDPGEDKNEAGCYPNATDRVDVCGGSGKQPIGTVEPDVSSPCSGMECCDKVELGNCKCLEGKLCEKPNGKCTTGFSCCIPDRSNMIATNPSECCNEDVFVREASTNNGYCWPEVPEDVPSSTVPAECVPSSGNTAFVSGGKCECNHTLHNNYICESGHWLRFITNDTQVCDEDKCVCSRGQWKIKRDDTCARTRAPMLPPIGLGQECCCSGGCWCPKGPDHTLRQNEWCKEISRELCWWSSGEEDKQERRGKVCQKNGDTCKCDRFTSPDCQCDGPVKQDACGACPTSSLNDKQMASVLGVSTKAMASDSIFLSPDEGMFMFSDEGAYCTEYNNSEYCFEITEPGTYSLYIDSNGNSVFDDGDVDIGADGVDLTLSLESVPRLWDIKAGFNFMSFDIVNEDMGNTASGILDFLNVEYDDAFYSIAKFESGRWTVVGNRDGERFGAEDFQVIPGRGYLLRSKRDVWLKLTGKVVVDPVPVSFKQGWNLIGVHGSGTTYTAGGLIDSIDSVAGLDVDNVTTWETTKAKYEGLQKESDDDGTMQVYGFDFPIDDKLGYFVRIAEGSGTWTP